MDATMREMLELLQSQWVPPINEDDEPQEPRVAGDLVVMLIGRVREVLLNGCPW